MGAVHWLGATHRGPALVLRHLAAEVGEANDDESLDACAHPRWAFRVNSPEIAIERWRTFQKEVVVGHKFVNERVVLDGKSYRTCTFENVTFVYEGRAPFDFIQNSVKGSINVDVGASQSLSNLTMFMKAIGMIAPSSAIVLGPERLPYDPHSKFPPEQPSRPR